MDTNPDSNTTPAPEKTPLVPFITKEQRITLTERKQSLINGRNQIVAQLSAQDAAISVIEEMLRASDRDGSKSHN